MPPLTPLKRPQMSGRRLKIFPMSMVALVALLLLTWAPFAQAQTLSDPVPSMDNPRRILISLNFKDENAVNSLLYNVINIQKYYGQDNLEIAVLGWGQGVRMLLQDSVVKARIESQMQYDIQFIACGNTLSNLGINPDNLIDGVELVKAGLPEIVERELAGWSIIWP